MVLATTFDFAGSPMNASPLFLIGFLGFMMFLVFAGLYFNLRNGHTYVDEHWGEGEIDDEEWGYSLAEARAATRRRLAELADRADR